MTIYEKIVSLENKALAAAAEDRYEDALRAHSQALEIAKNMNRPRLMAVLFERVGRVLEVKGEIQQAVIAYESGVKALASKEELNLKKVLRSLAAVGKEFYSQREPVPDLYSEAIAHDLETAEKSPTLPVSLLINIGNAYFRQPQEEPALNAYQKALQRPEIAQAPRLRAYALANIGEIRRRRGEIDAAAEALGQAMALFEMHANPLEKRRALALLAGIARDRGKIEEALNTYQQALDLYAQANDPLGEGRTHAGLARLLLSERRFADAQQSYQQAQKLAKRENDKETLWHVYWGLGRCYREAKEFNKALRSFRKSLNLIEARTDSLRTDEGKVTFLDSVQDVFDQLIGVYLEHAQLNAQSRYKQALRVAEKARARALRALMGGRERQRPSLGSRIRPSRRRPFAEQYQSYVELANDISSDRLPSPQMAPSTPSASDSGLLANRSFDNFSKLAPGTLSASTNDILANHLFENSSRLAQSTRSRSSTDRSTDEPPADFAPTTVELPPLARLVFHLLPDRTAIFAVRPDGSVQGHVAELGRQTLTERIEQLRQALGIDEELRGMDVDVDVELTRHSRPSGGTAASEATSLLRQLYCDLIAPIADWLPTDGTPVVIEPHGALWLLPFAALKLADGTWLIDKWPLLYAPSAGVLDEIRQEADYGKPSTLKALIAGNPTMPTVSTQNGLQITLQPLPGAEKEAEEIAALFPERHTLLLGANADLATIKKQATQHGILHLATHGIAYAEDPYASFIALAASPGDNGDNGDNGLLTAQDAIKLSLPADLVTLSACQTGLGHISGDGMIGLSRAFLVAGARAVLVSQWSVSDSATAALMTLFYRSYITLDNKAHALQLAMQSVRAMPEYKHPRYWASFVVVGAEA